MSNVKEIFADKDKKFPTFITKHAVFKKHKEIKKVFPEIGLPNSEKEIEVDNKAEAKATAIRLLDGLAQTIDDRLRTINKYATKKSDLIGKKRQKKFDSVKHLLTSVKVQISKSKTKCLITNNGRITINLPADVIDLENKVVFKAGEGLFRVYNKLNDLLREGHFLAMEKVENFQPFKEFSSKNVPSLKYKVRFSSEGSDGAWDIATMSMRGIQSCQSWTGGGHSTHVVGSVVDPFTGIVYLTSGEKFNEYGTKMIRRCIVRFMVNKTTKTPFLALERMYPSMERPALDSFISFLKEQTDNKLDVIYLPECRSYNNYVPMAKIVSSLSAQDQPYRDSQSVYEIDVNDVKGKIKEQVRTQVDSICSNFATKVVAAARAMKLSTIPVASKQAFKSLRGTDYWNDHSYVLYQDLQNEVKNFFAKFGIENYEDAALYMKDGITEFIASSLSDRIYSVVKSTTKRIPKALGVIDDGVLRTLSTVAQDKLTEYFAGELKKLVVKKLKAKKEKPADAVIPIYTKLLS